MPWAAALQPSWIARTVVYHLWSVRSKITVDNRDISTLIGTYDFSDDSART